LPITEADTDIFALLQPVERHYSAFFPSVCRSHEQKRQLHNLQMKEQIVTDK